MIGMEKPKYNDKNIEDVMIERQGQEYTFKPDLTLT